MAKSLPQWVAEEISSAKFEYNETWKYSGYALDLDKKNYRVDIQFYDKLPDGRHIATLETSDKELFEKIELAQVNMFEFKVFSSKLSEKVTTLLREDYKIQMEKIYKFELLSVEKLE